MIRRAQPELYCHEVAKICFVNAAVTRKKPVAMDQCKAADKEIGQDLIASRNRSVAGGAVFYRSFFKILDPPARGN